VTIYSNPKRFLHGPAAVVASNGDWLVAFQDSIDDPGHDSYIHQMRSHDQGKSWVSDDIVYDERDKEVGSRNPTFGVTKDGKIVLIVQRVGVCKNVSHPHQLLNCTYCVSSDNGKNYEKRGYVDSVRPRGHMGSPSHILSRDGVLYMGADSIDGLVLYTSEDDALSWQRRSTIIQSSEFTTAPSYPTIIFRSDGSLLLQCHEDQEMANYQKVSEDYGYTWKGLKPANIHLRHPVLTYVGDIMVAVGRLMPQWRTGFYLSDDDGENWKGPFDLAPDLDCGAGSYTGVIPLGKQVYVTFSSFLRLQGAVGWEPNAIQGVMLKDICVEGT
jgi:hypothetical protein